MTIKEMWELCWKIKVAIVEANDAADYQRVKWLKRKRREIRLRIEKIKNDLSRT